LGARFLIMPLWAPTALSASLAAPALLLAQRAARIAFRRKNGLCIRCSYDLRESKDRCPECGRPFKPRPKQKSLSPAPVS
jgi:predicted amidophosphoribosyltransferase